MKRCLCGLAMVMIFYSFAFPLVNLVQNPGFESGYVAWRGGASTVVIDTDAKSGAKALKIGAQTNTPTFVYQDIPVTAGKVYSLSAWIKQEGTGESKSYIYYWYFGTNMTVLNKGYVEYCEGAPYMLRKAATLAPDGAKTLRIELRNAGAGVGYQVTAHFDDVSVVAEEYVTSKTNILVNPGFENGTTGWSGITSNVTTSTERPRSGSYSLRMSNQGSYIHITQSVPVTAGDGFGFRGWSCLRTPSGDSAKVDPSLFPTAFYYLSFAGPDYSSDAIDMDLSNHASYFESAHEVLAPVGASNLWVQLWVFQGGPYVGYFDDVSVIKFTKNPNPPGIRLSTLSGIRSPSDQIRGVTDILGRRIFGALRSPDRIANGVYFALDRSSWATSQAVNMDTK